jgi:hypothetical protein
MHSNARWILSFLDRIASRKVNKELKLKLSEQNILGILVIFVTSYYSIILLGNLSVLDKYFVVYKVIDCTIQIEAFGKGRVIK